MSPSAPQERPTAQVTQPPLDEESTPEGLDRELRRMALLQRRAMIRLPRRVPTLTLSAVAVRRSR